MLEAGQILHSRYKITQKLGQNAGRQTWLAEDISTEPAKPVIVKLLAFGDQVQWEDLKLFEREADILKQLNHPRIPKYRDYFSIDDRILWFGLVQEYIPGKSLKDLLMEGRKFYTTEVEKIAIKVLAILSYLHEISPTVLHRDIKPSNLILGNDDKIYLVDFGAVQDKAATEGATFTVVGTYGYAPMEQFGGRAVPASDLYALGATLIHLLTGTSPADLPQENMRIQFQDKVSLDPNFVQWLEKLTNPDVKQRFNQARTAIQALISPNNHSLYAASVVKVQRPSNTRIKLYKSSERLEIIIPNRPKNYNFDRKFNSDSMSGGTKDFEILLTIIGYTFVISVFFIPITIIILGLSNSFINIVNIGIALLPLMFAGIFFIPTVVIILLLLRKIYTLFRPSIEKNTTLSRTRICLTCNNFVIEQKLWISTLFKITGLTSQIKEINQQKFNHTEQCIAIKFGTFQEERFGEQLTDLEQKWLIQEMKDWLDLK